MTASNRFVYDGWNLIAEINGTNNTLIRSYMWGGDLSGSTQGASGVGGLLELDDVATQAHFVCSDGNGSVAALINQASQQTSAAYEYGPFAEPLRRSGPLQENPLRFSTRTEDENGLLYYGHRYYSHDLGHWLSRDPAREQSFISLAASTRGQSKQVRADRFPVLVHKLPSPGENDLYRFIRNDPVDNIDPSGLDVYKVVVSADLSTGGSSVDHRMVVGDDGNGGTFVASFNQDPEKGFHLLGASCCGRGSVTVSRAPNTTAADWIKDAGAKVKVHLVTGYPELDKSMSDMADGYANYHPVYILGFNDCGDVANKFMNEAKDRIQRFTDSAFPDNFWIP